MAGVEFAFYITEAILIFVMLFVGILAANISIKSTGYAHIGWILFFQALAGVIYIIFSLYVFGILKASFFS
jgi:hypothetical protein